MQHLWFTERVIDIVAHELDLDPVEVRKKNFIRADEMPYETPNGCVYDSGDYTKMLDVALDLIGWDAGDARRQDAAARGKLLGIGSGATLRSGTGKLGQSPVVKAGLPVSCKHEVGAAEGRRPGEIVDMVRTSPPGP